MFQLEKLRHRVLQWRRGFLPVGLVEINPFGLQSAQTLFQFGPNFFRPEVTENLVFRLTFRPTQLIAIKEFFRLLCSTSLDRI
jgi:hypothetical protein